MDVYQFFGMDDTDQNAPRITDAVTVDGGTEMKALRKTKADLLYQCSKHIVFIADYALLCCTLVNKLTICRILAYTQGTKRGAQEHELD